MRAVPLGILASMRLKRHTWADIKARIKPEVRTRIEADARRLSDGLRSEAELQEPHSGPVGQGDRCKPTSDD